MPHLLRARGRAALFCAIALVVLGPAVSSRAAPASNPVVIDFGSGYSAGVVNGQQGWVLPGGSTASGGVPYDFAIVDLAGGTKALRVSNAAANPVFNSGLMTPRLDTVDAARESSAGGANNTFTAHYTIASATGAYQEGLNVEVSIGTGGDRSGGALMFRHVNGGLQIGAAWVPLDATSVSAVADWRSAALVGPLAGGLWDAGAPHEITSVVHFVDNGPDLVEHLVDGVPAGVMPTWEFYHAIASPASPKKSAANLMFRASSSAPSATGIGYDTGLPAAPATLGQGYLFTSLSFGASSVTGWTPAAPTTPVLAADDETALPPGEDLAPESLSPPTTTGERSLDLGAAFANQYVAVYIYSTPTFVGWFLADGTGVVRFSLPSSVPSGTHTIAVYEATGSLVGWVANVTVAAAVGAADLAPGGVDPAAPLLVAVLLAVAGAALAFRARGRSRQTF